MSVKTNLDGLVVFPEKSFFGTANITVSYRLKMEISYYLSVSSHFFGDISRYGLS